MKSFGFGVRWSGLLLSVSPPTDSAGNRLGMAVKREYSNALPTGATGVFGGLWLASKPLCSTLALRGGHAGAARSMRARRRSQGAVDHVAQNLNDTCFLDANRQLENLR